MALPDLRTVHAGFPHTALQSVVSSAGLAHQNVGLTHGEMPPFSEESIWPLPVCAISCTEMIEHGKCSGHAKAHR